MCLVRSGNDPGLISSLFSSLPQLKVERELQVELQDRTLPVSHPTHGTKHFAGHRDDLSETQSCHPTPLASRHSPLGGQSLLDTYLGKPLGWT